MTEFSMRAEAVQDSEHSVMFPPLVLLAALLVLLANLLDWLVPIEIMSSITFIEDIDTDGLAAFGAAVALAGVLLSFAGQSALKRHGAVVSPLQPVRVLVTDGVFARTRNPVYLGLWIALFGVALVFEFDWLAILAALAWVTVNTMVVRPEELYLAQRFGSAYQGYCMRVPRYFFVH